MSPRRRNYGNVVEFLFAPVTLNATITYTLVIAQFYLNNLRGNIGAAGMQQRLPAGSNIILRLPVYARIKAALVHASAMASTRIIILIKVMNRISLRKRV